MFCNTRKAWPVNGTGFLKTKIQSRLNWLAERASMPWVLENSRRRISPGPGRQAGKAAQRHTARLRLPRLGARDRSPGHPRAETGPRSRPARHPALARLLPRRPADPERAGHPRYLLLDRYAEGAGQRRRLGEHRGELRR